ncbi:MAG: methylmalonyl Co-A mutase-associated GTPase MeaB [Planctomycetes bacterium]|jgi:LAO/AO transport system kinase|nr:methylmalonyl Co-A mutase-associated GTPase MeaB [Planctomycetota bacterium]
MNLTPDRLVDGILKGEKAALARAITWVENGEPGGAAVLARLFPRTGPAWRIGVTGPPGCGKSTLVNALCAHYRKEGAPVGVVAVDPTSPFTGGALLGDRVRMQTVALDPGVFIRSMATRGELGGLCATAQDVADLLDAFGKAYVLLETVGVGQSEVEVADAADATVLVLAPGTGDSIQAMKAGVMEIANVLVVNKADRDDADRTLVEVESVLRLQEWGPDEWRPPVLKTVATDFRGVPELAGALADHRRFLEERGRLAGQRRKSCRKRLQNAAEALFRARILEEDRALFEEILDRVASCRESPREAARRLVEALGRGRPPAP